jgi:hypothetical protein
MERCLTQRSTGPGVKRATPAGLPPPLISIPASARKARLDCIIMARAGEFILSAAKEPRPGTLRPGG